MVRKLLGKRMNRIRKFLVWLCGDDRNALHTPPVPTLRCAKCKRLVIFVEIGFLEEDEWLHAEDASPICQPIGVYKA